jgi:hypothetical protein
MFEEEIKKEIIDIINKNRYYVPKKEICKLLLEIVDDINPINDEIVSEWISDVNVRIKADARLKKNKSMKQFEN